MDLQFTLDSYAVVTYVCDYWSKDESGMTEFLKQALKEVKHLENKDILSHLKRTYMQKRQIGKCEAIYRAIPSLNLQGSNIACTFVSSGYPENQSKFLKKVQETEQPFENKNGNNDSEDDSSDEEEQGETTAQGLKVFNWL